MNGPSELRTETRQEVAGASSVAWRAYVSGALRMCCPAHAVAFVRRLSLAGLILFAHPEGISGEAGAAAAVTNRLEVIADSAAGLEARLAAIEDLRRAGREVRDASAGLVAVVRDETAPLDLRRLAVLALEDVGFDTEEAAAAVFQVLADPRADRELRRTILMAHGERDEHARLLLPTLVEVLVQRENDTRLRRHALFALRRFPRDPTVAAALSSVLIDRTGIPELRSAVLDHIRSFEARSPAVLDALSAVVANAEEALELREKAVEALRSLGLVAGSAAPTLIRVAKDPGTNPALRLRAAEALTYTGWSQELADEVLEIVFAEGTGEALSLVAARLWETTGEFAEADPTRWRALLADKRRPAPLRRLAASVLAASPSSAPGRLALLARVFADSEEEVDIRLLAGESLWRMGSVAEPAYAQVRATIGEDAAPAEVKALAAAVVARIVQGWLGQAAELPRTNLNARLETLAGLSALMDNAGLNTARGRESAAEVRRVRAALSAEKALRWWERGPDWAERHPAGARWVGVALIGLFLFVGSATLWAVLARWAPLRLWDLNERWSRYDARLPARFGGHGLGFRHLLLLAYFANRDRVLDAAVLAYSQAVSSDFARRGDEAGLDRYIELSVTVDGKPYPSPPWELLWRHLARPCGGLLVAGEASSGKTALALECTRRLLARQREERGSRRLRLPIWLGANSPSSSERPEFVAWIHRVWPPRNSLGPGPSLRQVRSLLARGRLLPVLDGFSEWSEDDRTWFRKRWSAIAASGSGCLATLRRPEEWRLADPTVVTMQALDGQATIRFLRDWIGAGDRAARYGETDLAEACGVWSDLTRGRAMPVGMIRWYAEYLELKTEEDLDLPPAEHLSDLLGRYLARRSDGMRDAPVEEAQLARCAGEVAWLCLSRGGAAGQVEVDKLRWEDSADVPIRTVLDYLDRRLGLVRLQDDGRCVGAVSKPVAECLAARALVDRFGQNAEAWQGFLAANPRLGEGGLVGLAQAVLDEVVGSPAVSGAGSVPDEVLRELEHRLGEASGGARSIAETRIRGLVRRILAPENPERSRMIEKLGEMGEPARTAIPELLTAYRDRGVELEARYAALTALGVLGGASLETVPSLLATVRNRGDQLFLRLKAIELLGGLIGDDPRIREVLTERSADPDEAEPLRRKAAEAIGDRENHLQG